MQKLIPTLAIFFLAITTTHAQDMPLRDILISGEEWQLVGEGFKFTEGPATDASGTVYFTDVPTSTIYVIGEETRVFDDQAERTSGLVFGPGNQLFACRNGGKKLVVYPRDDSGELSSEANVLAEDVSVNDLTVDRWSGVYFTDPKNRRVGYCSPTGRINYVATDLNPNGIVLSAKGGTLVVTERDHPWLWTFRVEQHGFLSNRAPFYGVVQTPPETEQPKSDGMTFDDDGRLYLASAKGLQVFDTLGRYSGTISKPQDSFLSNVVFGGPDFDTLYVTCQDKVYRRKVKPSGRPDFLANE